MYAAFVTAILTSPLEVVTGFVVATDVLVKLIN